MYINYTFRFGCFTCVKIYLKILLKRITILLHDCTCLMHNIKPNHQIIFSPQFFYDLHDSEQWMGRQAELLNVRYDRPELTAEEVHQLLQELKVGISKNSLLEFYNMVCLAGMHLPNFHQNIFQIQNMDRVNNQTETVLCLNLLVTSRSHGLVYLSTD